MSITKRKTGGWQSQVNIGQEIDPKTWKTRYLRDSATFDTKAEAVAWAKDRKRRAEEDARNFVQPSKEPLKDYLPRWLERKEREGLRPSTIESYETAIRLYIIPALGTIALRDLPPAAVRRMVDGILATGHARTAANARNVLRIALGAAVKDGTLSTNVCDRVPAPKYEPQKRGAFSEEEFALLMSEVAGTRIKNLVPFAAYTGLRPGELVALCWQDVDLDKGTLSVRKSKTKAGLRTVTLPRPALDALQAQRDMQFADRKAALASGTPWRNPEGYVFATARGGPLDRKNVARDFRKFRRRAGLADNLPLYSLRHTNVSLNVAAGVPLELISKRIGHTKFSFTLDQYGHLLPEADRDATDALDRYLARRKDAKPHE